MSDQENKWDLTLCFSHPTPSPHLAAPTFRRGLALSERGRQDGCTERSFATFEFRIWLQGLGRSRAVAFVQESHSTTHRAGGRPKRKTGKTSKAQGSHHMTHQICDSPTTQLLVSLSREMSPRVRKVPSAATEQRWPGLPEERQVCLIVGRGAPSYRVISAGSLIL